MGLLDFLSGIVSPVTNLIGKFVEKDEQKAQLTAAIAQMQTGIAQKILEYEQQISTLQSNIIVAEAQSTSWLTKSWRPITMIVFLSIIIYQGIFVSLFGLPSVHFETIPDKMWTLLTVGIGGYIGSRGLEKIVPSIVDSIKSKRNGN